MSLKASVSTDFSKQPSTCKKRFMLPVKLYPDTSPKILTFISHSVKSFYSLTLPHTASARDAPTLHHLGTNMLRSPYLPDYSAAADPNSHSHCQLHSLGSSTTWQHKDQLIFRQPFGKAFPPRALARLFCRDASLRC